MPRANRYILPGVSLDLLDNPTVSRTILDRAARRVVQSSDGPASTLDALNVSLNGLVLTNITATGVLTTHAYDPLGRRILSRTGDRLVALSGYDSLGRVAWTADAANTTNRYAYDPFTGRRVSTSTSASNFELPTSNFVSYDPEGRVVATWGATYPVAYEYDAYGRMAAMYTLRDSTLQIAAHADFLANKAAFDRTTWLYDEPTGLLTNKVYADGKGTAYSYSPDGKLAQRTWARGIATAYGYDNTGSLTNILYSDSTPSVTFAYDRLGRQTNVIQSSTGVPPVVHEYSYDPATLALAEERLPDGTVLTRSQDALGRAAGIALGSGYAAAYGYDAYGRFGHVASAVGASVVTNTYSYLPGSHLMAGWSNDFTTVSRAYEPHRDLLTQVRNVAGGVTVSQYDYANDPLGRRTLREDSGSAFGVAITNAFGYSIRSEVESALMGTNQYGYAFDPIGNRASASLNAVTNLYAANALNQYTNVLAAMPPRDDTPVYDDDGNILRLRDWTLEWDGENRLVLASNATVTVRYAHDFMGRRVWRATDGVTNRFDYDGWALIRERTESDGTVVTNHYVYGMDLSSSLQGAGTIGGILSANLDGTTVFYAYDGNGNVTDLVDTNGVVAEHYEYSPFGETIAHFRNPAFTQSQPFRFSTKRQDEDTGLLYYGYRDLDTVWGRWLSRDPIGERGGHGLYVIARNSALVFADALGLEFIDGGKTGTAPINWDPINGAGGTGDQGAGEWERKTDPQYESSGCKCWVKDGTGLATVRRSYTGVTPGIQGPITPRVEDRGNGVIVTVYSMAVYVTQAAAQAIDYHEQAHIDLSKAIYDDTIKLAEDQVEAYRAATPHVIKNCWFFCGTRCINQLKALIDWDNRFQQFDTRDTAMNIENGIVDSDPISEFGLINSGKESWTLGPNAEYEAIEYIDVE